MKQILKSFRSDETGAITVDWVVLTAATILLGLLIILAVKPATMTKLETELAAVGMSTE